VRIRDRFEQRIMAILGELMTEEELARTDHEITGILMQQPLPTGGMQPILGFHLALSRPTMVLNEHILMTDTCPDPYLNDAELRLKMSTIVTQLREALLRLNGEHANGKTAVPPGGRLIIPGRG
jgi:hypothetical protein